MFMFFICKERVHEESADGTGEQVSFAKGLVGLVKNKYWMLMVVSLFAMYFMMSCFFESAFYFTMYNMGSDSYYAMVSNLLSIFQIITLFITPFIMKKVSKRYLFMAGMAIATVGFVLSGLTTSYTLICLSSIIKGIGFGCGGATMFGCLQDASINVAFAWVPVITSVICVVCMLFFDVDKYYGKVVEDLSQGKYREK